VTANVNACAHYFKTLEDTDSDGIPDWFEWHMTGGLTDGTDSDGDGDGFGMGYEHLRESHPGLRDQITAGGIGRRRSSLTPVYGTGYLPFVIDSAPAGFIYDYGFVTSGSVVVTEDLAGEAGGYTFTEWRIDGTRQEDALGRALGHVTFTVTGSTTATAHYVESHEDADSDGISDWYEYHFFGTTNRSAAIDHDGDGLTLESEFSRGYHPMLKNQLRVGGVSRRRSPHAVADLQLWGPDTDGDGMPDWWEADHFSGPTNAVADIDSDHDTHENYHEFLVGTDPHDPDDVFQIYGDTPEAGNFIVVWESLVGRIYTVYLASNLTEMGWTNAYEAPGTGRTMTYTDNGTNVPARFFRVGAELWDGSDIP